MPNAYNVESSIEDGQDYNVAVFPQVQPKIIGPGQYISLSLTPLGDFECSKVFAFEIHGWHVI